MVYILVLLADLSVGCQGQLPDSRERIANLGSVNANIYSFGPEFISKEYCEQFAKQLPKDRANSHLCLPIK